MFSDPYTQNTKIKVRHLECECKLLWHLSAVLSHFYNYYEKSSVKLSLYCYTYNYIEIEFTELLAPF